MDAGFKDGNENPVTPEIYSRKTWYTERLKSLTRLIAALELSKDVESHEKH